MEKENLLPGMGSDQWTTWQQRGALAPAFERRTADGAPALVVASSRFEQFGKWICSVPGIAGGQTYRFSAEYRTEGVCCDTTSVHAMLTWLDAGGKVHTRDYAHRAPAAGAWKRLERTVEAPAEAASLVVELAFKWSDGGSVTWRGAAVEAVEPVKHRLVKVASAFIEKTGTLDGNLEQMLRVIDKAGAENADIVCLGETVYDWGVPLPLEQRCVEIPGPAFEALSERARRHNMYIVLSINEKENGYFYNTGLLIDRKGGVAGKYRKMQLPLCEGEDGITPGRDYPVFDTDFGRVGILICWDHGFPEASRALAMKGAEIIFLPTLWHTEIQARARAADNGVFVVVSAPRWTKTPCRVIDPEGEVVASIMGGEHNENGVCAATIDLDKRYYTFWMSVGAAFGERHSCMMQEPRWETFGAVAD